MRTNNINTQTSFGEKYYIPRETGKSLMKNVNSCVDKIIKDKFEKTNVMNDAWLKPAAIKTIRNIYAAISRHNANPENHLRVKSRIPLKCDVFQDINNELNIELKAEIEAGDFTAFFLPKNYNGRNADISAKLSDYEILGLHKYCEEALCDLKEVKKSISKQSK